ncbi:MAG: hypothetical protein B6D58_05500 [candidate division Zixibacteria bacterium 4484_95]|nr:MAG: hypothetical protein B6D58_05500 [candidate division Zixibacteria bacterium 4484_95]
MNRIFFTVFGVLLLTVVIFGQSFKSNKAPDFTLPDLNGNNVKLSDVIGEGPVYINFWATWCGPCKREIPELVKLYEKYHDRGLEILAISTDGTRSEGKVRAFVESYKMKFPVLLDSDKEVFHRKYKGFAIPYGILVDNEGNVLHSAYGFRPGDEKKIIDEMQKYLSPVKDKDIVGEKAGENPIKESDNKDKKETSE